MTAHIPRRAALKVLAATLTTPALGFAAEPKPGGAKWKTAIGLNGFQSGSRKYRRNYPIWEVLDFASRNSFEGVELVADWPSGGYVQFCDTDGTLRDGGTSKHLACGDGHVDCAKSLKLLREGGFRGWIMVAEWEVPDPYDACIKCKRAIDQAWRA